MRISDWSSDVCSSDLVADYVAGKRSFGTTTMTVVLRGNVMHDGRWMSQGDMYMSPPDEMNGDLVFGPDGAVLFILFDKRSGILPKFPSKKEKANFDRLFRQDEIGRAHV